MELKAKNTRFRAYQLGNEGSSFSYCDGNTFTLIEARLTEKSEPSVMYELKQYNKTRVDVLHITSWDNDHCRPNELINILNKLRPKKIEYPGYKPHTDSGEESLKLINKYKKILDEKNDIIDAKSITPEFLESLESANGFGYSNILYHPDEIVDNSNDNSTVKLFRSGSFTLLSLGDVESEDTAKKIMNRTIAKTETDVMILAHHGANNGFTTDKFLKAIKPRVAICSSNYDNKFEHPKDEIKQLLYDNEIKLFTTKTGDVIIKSINEHKGEFQVINLISDNETVSSKYIYKSKRLK